MPKKTKEIPKEGSGKDNKGDGTNKYDTSQKVLVVDVRMIYKALVRDKQQNADGGEWFYFIHYDGWNKKWDAWVEEAKIMADTKDNLEKMENVNRETKESLKAKKTQKKTDENGGTSKADQQDERTSKKRKIDQQRELEDFLEPQVRVPIPFVLKKTLVDDWEWVTRSNLLVPLPRKPCVQDILKNYLDGKMKRRPGTNSSLSIHSEFADGLQDYFDRALGTILLYRHERAQYQSFRDKEPKAQASAHYGAEHLLRLFVRLPTLLANTDLSDVELSVLQVKIADFLKYLVKNHEELFCLKYVPISSGPTAAVKTEVTMDPQTTKVNKDEVATSKE